MSADGNGEEGQQQAQRPRPDPRIKGIEHDLGVLKEAVAKSLEILEERRRQAPVEPETPTLFNDPAEQASFENAKSTSSVLQSQLLGKEMSFSNVYDLNATMAQTDVNMRRWLWLTTMSVLLRSDKLEALLAQPGTKSRGERLGKYIPVVVLGVVASMLIGGLFYGNNFAEALTALQGAWSDPRIQIWAVAASFILLGALIYSLLRRRRKDQRMKMAAR